MKTAPIIAMRVPPKFSPRRSALLELLVGVEDVVLLLETELVLAGDGKVDCMDDDIVGSADPTVVVELPAAPVEEDNVGVTEVELKAVEDGEVLIVEEFPSLYDGLLMPN
jgi:hypothetical protein